LELQFPEACPLWANGRARLGRLQEAPTVF